MNIKFEIRMEFLAINDEERRYRADVTFLVPKERGNEYVSEMYQSEIGDHCINYWSGDVSPDYPESRKVIVYFYGSGMESLEREVIDSIKKYREAVKENVERHVKARNYVKEIDMDFPDLP